METFVGKSRDLSVLRSCDHEFCILSLIQGLQDLEITTTAVELQGKTAKSHITTQIYFGLSHLNTILTATWPCTDLAIFMPMSLNMTKFYFWPLQGSL